MNSYVPVPFADVLPDSVAEWGDVAYDAPSDRKAGSFAREIVRRMRHRTTVQ